MRLHYVLDEDPTASERWLPGIPASDFETADAREIAVCLASGLYAEAEAPVGPASPAGADAPESTPVASEDTKRPRRPAAPVEAVSDAAQGAGESFF